jgi:hypothetical protein
LTEKGWAGGREKGVIVDQPVWRWSYLHPIHEGVLTVVKIQDGHLAACKKLAACFPEIISKVTKNIIYT